jgi:hypothetical protein
LRLFSAFFSSSPLDCTFPNLQIVNVTLLATFPYLHAHPSPTLVKAQDGKGAQESRRVETSI